jgi:hypothetical protein
LRCGDEKELIGIQSARGGFYFALRDRGPAEAMNNSSGHGKRDAEREIGVLVPIWAAPITRGVPPSSALYGGTYGLCL